MYQDHWFGGGIMWMFLLIIAIFIIFLGGSFYSNKNKLDNEKSALDILKERYARGEIDQEEYELKKRELLS